jgi:hypothetical protein
MGRAYIKFPYTVNIFTQYKITLQPVWPVCDHVSSTSKARVGIQVTVILSRLPCLLLSQT